MDDNVPSLGLFTERFCNRMIELADDIDISVAVSAIGLLKQLLRYLHSLFTFKLTFMVCWWFVYSAEEILSFLFLQTSTSNR